MCGLHTIVHIITHNRTAAAAILREQCICRNVCVFFISDGLQRSSVAVTVDRGIDDVDVFGVPVHSTARAQSGRSEVAPQTAVDGVSAALASTLLGTAAVDDHQDAVVLMDVCDVVCCDACSAV